MSTSRYGAATLGMAGEQGRGGVVWCPQVQCCVFGQFWGQDSLRRGQATCYCLVQQRTRQASIWITGSVYQHAVQEWTATEELDEDETPVDVVPRGVPERLVARTLPCPATGSELRSLPAGHVSLIAECSTDGRAIVEECQRQAHRQHLRTQIPSARVSEGGSRWY